MLKKIVLGSFLAAGIAGLGFGSSAFSYIRTGLHTLRSEVKSQIPVEVELNRARDMINQIKPEIATNLHRIAREEVEVDRLDREVARKSELQIKCKSQIMQLTADLQQDKANFTYAGRKYSADQVREDLSSRFEAFKSQEAVTQQLQKTLTARQQKLTAARLNLERMLAEKRQLEVEVEHMTARLMMVQIASTNSELSIDSSHLARTKDLIAEVKSRIDVAEKLSTQDAMPLGMIPLDQPESTDVISAITEYFSDDELAKL